MFVLYKIAKVTDELSKTMQIMLTFECLLLAVILDKYSEMYIKNSYPGSTHFANISDKETIIYEQIITSRYIVAVQLKRNLQFKSIKFTNQTPRETSTPKRSQHQEVNVCSILEDRSPHHGTAPFTGFYYLGALYP